MAERDRGSTFLGQAGLSNLFERLWREVVYGNGTEAKSELRDRFAQWGGGSVRNHIMPILALPTLSPSALPIRSPIALPTLTPSILSHLSSSSSPLPSNRSSYGELELGELELADLVGLTEGQGQVVSQFICDNAAH
jgi:hypothetical protein